MTFLFISCDSYSDHYTNYYCYYCRGLHVYITVVHFSSDPVVRYTLFLLFRNVRIWSHSQNASVNGSSPIRSRVYSGTNIIRDLKMAIKSPDSKFQCCLHKKQCYLFARQINALTVFIGESLPSSPAKHSLSLQINYSTLMEYCCIFRREDKRVKKPKVRR